MQKRTVYVTNNEGTTIYPNGKIEITIPISYKDKCDMNHKPKHEVQNYKAYKMKHRRIF